MENCMGFFPNLKNRQNSKKTSLCVGLDPNPQKFPEGLLDGEKGVYEFCSHIVEATEPWVCAFKPQIAYFSAMGWGDVLVQIIRDIHEKFPQTPVILDAKRNDIGSTAEAYAREAFEYYGADAVTLNPYMGVDAIEPFLQYSDRGLFVLCRTSNPSANTLQNLTLHSGEPLYKEVARQVLQWGSLENIGLVVGATVPDELADLAETFPEAWFLVPGVGAQGGNLKTVMEKGTMGRPGGVIVNSARGILYASSQADYANKAGEAAATLQKQMAHFFTNELDSK